MPLSQDTPTSVPDMLTWRIVLMLGEVRPVRKTPEGFATRKTAYRRRCQQNCSLARPAATEQYQGIDNPGTPVIGLPVGWQRNDGQVCTDTASEWYSVRR